MRENSSGPSSANPGSPAAALRAKYGASAFDIGLKSQPRTFERRLAQRDGLDQHYTKLWLDFDITGVGRRSVLDPRTRLLVLIGQYTMGKSHGFLDDTIRAALTAHVPAREILEIILQCTVYGGQTTVDPAIDVFDRIAQELNLEEELRRSQLPLDGNDRKRSIEAERRTWHPDDVADPRFDEFMERYGWLAVGRGLTMRPKHHLDFLHWLDAMDRDFAALWIRFAYQGMYSRGHVDDKTRLLCMVGDCLAVRELGQGREHMRGALRNGASAREVLEVIWITAINFGLASMVQPLKILGQILEEQGRLAEIGNPPKSDEHK